MLTDHYAGYGERNSVRPRIDMAKVCAEIRSSFSVSSVARSAGVKLHRAGREWKGLCPFHGEKSPSFTIYADDRRFCCFGCGAEGDVLDFVTKAYGVGLVDAIDMLDAGALRELKGQLAPPAPRKDLRGVANRIVQQSSPIEGTPAETYLRRRGITMALPHTLRFARLAPPKQPDDNGVLVANGPGLLPCLVAIVSDPDGELVGIQRTYLTEDGQKAATTDRKVKYSLGNVAGGAIQLGPPAANIVVTEGLEDGLSLAQVVGQTVWVAAGTKMLPQMVMPPIVRAVTIGRDADEAGERAALAAAEAFRGNGVDVRIVSPASGFKDFNDELMGVRA
ncbi:CHC2 zinc finger domain-containing protein [uncultured Sphingomonas sp.]|uniref:DUF7146 domain-containing protein n=1 Tax=uncultured Sphingomonas sp. TaxID=158754 RepID=UPI0037492230